MEGGGVSETHFEYHTQGKPLQFYLSDTPFRCYGSLDPTLPVKYASEYFKEFQAS